MVVVHTHSPIYARASMHTCTSTCTSPHTSICTHTHKHTLTCTHSSPAHMYTHHTTILSLSLSHTHTHFTCTQSSPAHMYTHHTTKHTHSLTHTYTHTHTHSRLRQGLRRNRNGLRPSGNIRRAGPGFVGPIFICGLVQWVFSRGPAGGATSHAGEGLVRIFPKNFRNLWNAHTL